MRYVAIDLGDRRTGLAVGDRITGIVSPADLLDIPRERNGGADLLNATVRALDDLVGPHSETVSDAEPSVLVGHPINMDGSEGPRAKIARAFAQSLADTLGQPVLLWDERRTSVRADEHMARTGLTHKQKKKRRDALAAAAILQDFLDHTSGQGLPAFGMPPGDEKRPEQARDEGFRGSVVRPQDTNRTAE